MQAFNPVCVPLATKGESHASPEFRGFRFVSNAALTRTRVDHSGWDYSLREREYMDDTRAQFWCHFLRTFHASDKAIAGLKDCAASTLPEPKMVPADSTSFDSLFVTQSHSSKCAQHNTECWTMKIPNLALSNSGLDHGGYVVGAMLHDKTIFTLPCKGELSLVMALREPFAGDDERVQWMSKRLDRIYYEPKSITQQSRDRTEIGPFGNFEIREVWLEEL
ncbi:hypothetical protein CIRG_05113 [Coccidioides immitis RMSCC 2394]|uniref:Uncharacterized protein n=1 Tax=Coccidioides immitis RMSCC 2394 TaxID=404692 RepID=A0A0J7B668_COCIT|nr:hypothetical protein CIRG_05113 [Coccidioides immitis RMSCC 2394]